MSAELLGAALAQHRLVGQLHLLLEQVLVKPQAAIARGLDDFVDALDRGGLHAHAHQGGDERLVGRLGALLDELAQRLVGVEIHPLVEVLGERGDLLGPAFAQGLAADQLEQPGVGRQVAKQLGRRDALEHVLERALRDGVGQRLGFVLAFVARFVERRRTDTACHQPGDGGGGLVGRGVEPAIQAQGQQREVGACGLQARLHGLASARLGLEAVLVDDALLLPGRVAEVSGGVVTTGHQVSAHRKDVVGHLAQTDCGPEAHRLGGVDQVRGQPALAVGAHDVAHALADRALEVLQRAQVIDRGGRKRGVNDLAIQHRGVLSHADQVDGTGALFDAQLIEVALDHAQRHTGGLRHAQALGGEIRIVAQGALEHGAGAILLQVLLLLRQGQVGVVLLFSASRCARLGQGQVIRHLAGPFFWPARYISTMACSVTIWPVACSAWVIWRRSSEGTTDTGTFLPLTRT